MKKTRFPRLPVVLWTLISLATLFPIYWLFVISVKQPFDLFSTPDVILRSFFWKNYQDVLTNPTLRGYMLNSMIISSGNALLVTTLGFLACYALTRFDLAGKESIFFWTITNRMAPPAVFLLPLFLLLTQVYRIGDFSLADSKLGMIWSIAPSTFPSPSGRCVRPWKAFRRNWTRRPTWTARAHGPSSTISSSLWHGPDLQ